MGRLQRLFNRQSLGQVVNRFIDVPDYELLLSAADGSAHLLKLPLHSLELRIGEGLLLFVVAVAARFSVPSAERLF